MKIFIEAYPVALRKEDRMIMKMIKTATTLVKVSVLYVVAMVVFMTLGFTISRPVFDSKSDVCGNDNWL
ncbi:hypothetical protein [Lacrimispora sp.]|uniref:hypothetical protein n=1 Tax=Lacrimispora sp. TaxID=2719234 RepID=UPI00286E91D8|nr:hypothetical protein [Lacrimispora sp.]